MLRVPAHEYGRGKTGRRPPNKQDERVHISKKSDKRPVLVVNDGMILSQTRDKDVEKKYFLTLELCSIPGKGLGVSQNFQKFRVRVWTCYRTSRRSGYCGTGIQNSQNFRAGTKHDAAVPRVLMHGSCKTHRGFGYGHESLTELPEVWYGYEFPELPGIVARAYRNSKSSGQV